MADDHESLSIKGSRSIIQGLLILAAGGGIGASAIGFSQGRDATVQPTPWLSRSETEGVASKAASEARHAASEEIKAANAATLADCTARMNATYESLTKRLDKLDQVAEDVAALRALSKVPIRSR
jgi:uncharacterized protein HemX